jgi:hypothetical protein
LQKGDEKRRNEKEVNQAEPEAGLKTFFFLALALNLAIRTKSPQTPTCCILSWPLPQVAGGGSPRWPTIGQLLL